jgi:hypothetical protein
MSKGSRIQNGRTRRITLINIWSVEQARTLHAMVEAQVPQVNRRGVFGDAFDGHRRVDSAELGGAVSMRVPVAVEAGTGRYRVRSNANRKAPLDQGSISSA